MCLSPISVPNPYLGSKNPFDLRCRDTKSARINVPCQECADCKRARQASFVQRAQNMMLDHHCFFATLTYNNEMIPRAVLPDGNELMFADIRDIRLAIKRIRKNNLFTRDFSYLAVSERGGRKGRPHFHVLFFVKKMPGDEYFTLKQLERTMYWALRNEWRRHYGATNGGQYKPLFTYRERWRKGKLERNYDLHYADPASTDKGETSVAYYVTKYVLKTSKRQDKIARFLYARYGKDVLDEFYPIVKDKMLISKHFGCSTETQWRFLKECIAQTRNSPSGLRYNNHVDGWFPMCRYFKKKVRKYFEHTPFGDHVCIKIEPLVEPYDFICSIDATGGPYALPRARTRTEIYKTISDFNRIKSLLNDKYNDDFCLDIDRYY